jgi:hypothetical protein
LLRAWRNQWSSSPFSSGGTINRPVTGSPITRELLRLWNETRTNTSLPASRPSMSCRTVKSVVSSACGPRMRLTSRNCSSYDHSTSMRAGRSLRLHTITEPPLGSPKDSPCSACGRSLSAAMIAGAPFVRLHAGRTTPAAVAMLAFRNRRRDDRFRSLIGTLLSGPVTL